MFRQWTYLQINQIAEGYERDGQGFVVNGPNSYSETHFSETSSAM